MLLHLVQSTHYFPRLSQKIIVTPHTQASLLMKVALDVPALAWDRWPPANKPSVTGVYFN